MHDKGGEGGGGKPRGCHDEGKARTSTIGTGVPDPCLGHPQTCEGWCRRAGSWLQTKSRGNCPLCESAHRDTATKLIRKPLVWIGDITAISHLVIVARRQNGPKLPDTGHIGLSKEPSPKHRSALIGLNQQPRTSHRPCFHTGPHSHQ